MVNLLLTLSLVVLQDHLLILRLKLFHATVQAFILPGVLAWRVWDRDDGRSGLLADVFQMNLVGHSIKIERGVTHVSLSDLRSLASDPVDCFVGQVLGGRAAAADKNLDEAAADLLVP